MTKYDVVKLLKENNLNATVRYAPYKSDKNTIIELRVGSSSLQELLEFERVFGGSVYVEAWYEEGCPTCGGELGLDLTITIPAQS